jgi:hypothetical protein
MVSSPEALADQVDGSPKTSSLDFFPAFMASPERAGWWLTHESPPRDAAAVASRVRPPPASSTPFRQAHGRRQPTAAARAVALDVLGVTSASRRVAGSTIDDDAKIGSTGSD